MGNTHLRSSRGLEPLSQRAWWSSWQTAAVPLQPDRSQCGRGRAQAGVGIYSELSCQMVPPYDVTPNPSSTRETKMYLPSSGFLANDWRRHVCQEGAFCVAWGEPARERAKAPPLPDLPQHSAGSHLPYNGISAIRFFSSAVVFNQAPSW